MKVTEGKIEEIKFKNQGSEMKEEGKIERKQGKYQLRKQYVEEEKT